MNDGYLTVLSVTAAAYSLHSLMWCGMVLYFFTERYKAAF